MPFPNTLSKLPFQNSLSQNADDPDDPSDPDDPNDSDYPDKTDYSGTSSLSHLGFLLSERTSGVSPVIFRYYWAI